MSRRGYDFGSETHCYLQWAQTMSMPSPPQCSTEPVEHIGVIILRLTLLATGYTPGRGYRESVDDRVCTLPGAEIYSSWRLACSGRV